MERKLFASGYTFVAGCDEVGRGCLAGPVVAAAVGWRPSVASLKSKVKSLKPEGTFGGPWVREVADSKVLSAKKREVLSRAIKQSGLLWSVGVVSPQAVDRLNIHHASLLAMRRAVEKLHAQAFHGAVPRSMLLVDGRFPVSGWSGEQQAIVDGDAKIFSIAAASIVAKVYRDNLMVKLHAMFPGYGFDRHKGYATQQHRDAITRHGLTVHHRRTFCTHLTSEP